MKTTYGRGKYYLLHYFCSHNFWSSTKDKSYLNFSACFSFPNFGAEGIRPWIPYLNPPHQQNNIYCERLIILWHSTGRFLPRPLPPQFPRLRLASGVPSTQLQSFQQDYQIFTFHKFLKRSPHFPTLDWPLWSSFVLAPRLWKRAWCRERDCQMSDRQDVFPGLLKPEMSLCHLHFGLHQSIWLMEFGPLNCQSHLECSFLINKSTFKL